jgi:hypothetical protein
VFLPSSRVKQYEKNAGSRRMSHSTRDYVDSDWFSGKTKKLIRFLEREVSTSAWEEK